MTYRIQVSDHLGVVDCAWGFGPQGQLVALEGIELAQGHRFGNSSPRTIAEYGWLD